MTKKELIESLSDLPDNADICLSTFMLATTEDDEGYNVILDQPIGGIAYHEDDNEIRFVVVAEKYKDAYSLAAFGVAKVEKL